MAKKSDQWGKRFGKHEEILRHVGPFILRIGKYVDAYFASVESDQYEWSVAVKTKESDHPMVMFEGLCGTIEDGKREADARLVSICVDIRRALNAKVRHV